MLVIFLFCSCQKEEHYRVPEIAGNYQMKSLQTEYAVDINNDGHSSTDAMAQISQVDYITQYDFNSSGTYLEILPTNHNSRYQHIYIPFPTQRVFFDSPDKLSARVVYQMNYLNGIGYGYSYDEKNKTIHLDRTTVKEETEQEWGKLVDIRVLDKDRLQLLVNKDYYDFKQKSWIRLQFTALYKKVSK
jgi:hypothetical protein